MVYGQKTHTMEFCFSVQPMYSHPVGVIPSANDSYTIWLQSETLQDKFSFDRGFYIDFFLSKRLVIGTGIRWINRGLYRYYSPGSEIIYASDGIHDSIFSNTYLEGREWEDNYYSFPLQIGYRFFDFKKSALSLRFGGSFDLMFSSTDRIEYTFGSNSTIIDYNDTERLEYEFFLSLGLRYNYFFNDNSGIFCEPQLNISLSERQELLGLRFRYFTYGLNFGLFFRL